MADRAEIEFIFTQRGTGSGGGTSKPVAEAPRVTPADGSQLVKASDSATAASRAGQDAQREAQREARERLQQTARDQQSLSGLGGDASGLVSQLMGAAGLGRFGGLLQGASGLMSRLSSMTESGRESSLSQEFSQRMARLAASQPPRIPTGPPIPAAAGAGAAQAGESVVMAELAGGEALASAGASAAGGLSAVSAAAGPIGIALAAATMEVGAVVVAFRELKQATDLRIEQLRAFSPNIAGAGAQQEMLNALNNLERAQRLGPQLASIVEQEGRFERALTRVGDNFVEAFSPILEEFLASGTEIFKLLSAMQENFLPLWELINELGPRSSEILAALNRFLNIEEDKPRGVEPASWFVSQPMPEPSRMRLETAVGFTAAIGGLGDASGVVLPAGAMP